MTSRSPEETRRVGERIGRWLSGGEFITLEGELGTGKTHLAQGLAAGLDIKDDPVTSPTFVFIHEFRGRSPFAHMDLFRIEHEEDLLDLGLLEYLDGPWVVAVEWAEKAEGLLPSERLRIRIIHQGERSRQIELEACGDRYRNILDHLKDDPSFHRPPPRMQERNVKKI